jgi:hypothetical protein
MAKEPVTVLTGAEISALLNALQSHKQSMHKTSENVDLVTDDPDKYDPAHEHFAAQAALADRLFDLLDEAESVEIRGPSDE